MDKIKLKKMVSSLLVVALSFFVVSCKKDQPTGQLKSSEKDLLTFEFFKEDNSALVASYNTSFTNNTIAATLPSGTNLSALKAAFTLSEKVTVSVNGKLQTSQESANDFRQPVIYTVKAEDGSTKNYTVILSTR
jgi:hypothetical protein